MQTANAQRPTLNVQRSIQNGVPARAHDLALAQPSHCHFERSEGSHLYSQIHANVIYVIDRYLRGLSPSSRFGMTLLFAL
jgi:hypothetical protein